MNNQSYWIKVDKKRFKCQCGCELFHHVDNDENTWQCNCCNVLYKSEFIEGDRKNL